jgi:outer membrane protein assembly factor BamD
MKKTLRLLLLILLTSSLLSCSKKEEKNSAELTYKKAMKALENKNYSEAAEIFSKIDDDYPFSKWALKAQTMSVYAYYKEEQYDKLQQTVDDFVRLNPVYPDIDYMIYMKGLSLYNQIPDINRAQDNTKQASFAFRELIARFPDSKYSEDAKEKLSFIDEHLAGAVMSIGRYQIKTHNFVGAIDSFNQVINRYHYSKQVAEAYFRLVEIYYKIGINSEALGAFNNLKTFYPKSTWRNLAVKIDPKLFK